MPATSPINREVREDVFQALIGRMAGGDQEALAALYDATSPMVHGLAVRILHDEPAAEDVTIDVYMQAFRRASRYDAARGSPLTWLFTFARSRAIDRLRSEAQRRRRELPLETIEMAPETAADPAESTLAGESRRAVHAAMTALTPEQRRAIELAYYSGMSHSEIAQVLGEPLGTVKTRIRRGMLALRRGLRPFQAEDRA